MSELGERRELRQSLTVNFKQRVGGHVCESWEARNRVTPPDSQIGARGKEKREERSIVSRRSDGSLGGELCVL